MHNRLYRFYPIDRLAHTDFDKNDENTFYIQYWGRAAAAGFEMVIDWFGEVF
jgi:hypothetical protein